MARFSIALYTSRVTEKEELGESHSFSDVVEAPNSATATVIALSKIAAQYGFVLGKPQPVEKENDNNG